MIKNTLLICGLMFGLLTTAHAETAAISNNVIQLSVLPGYRTNRGTHMAALRIQLQPGWKTYWRAPGDGGIPPQFDWSGSKNIQGIEFHWPRPKVSYINGLRTIAYTNEVVIPIELSPRRRDTTITLKGRVDLGVCNDICIPMSLKFSATLPSGNTKVDPMIRAALKKVPTPAHKAGVKTVTCTIEPISDGLRLTATITLPSTGRDEIAVIEAPNQNIWVSEATTSRRGNTLTATTEMVPPSNAPFMLDRSKIRITVIGSNRAVDILGCTG
ncbi:hypothetical protein JI58_09210 [Marinosulfonomonas sp. PRT-SC04]|nr:hypothetical protein JI58_09210 [Marinosulfonomonas sp. PRT-SC04]